MATQLEGVKDLTGKLTELGAKFATRELRGVVNVAIGEALHKARTTIPVGTLAHRTYRGRIVSPGYALSTLHVETKIDKKTGSAIAFLGVGREAFYAVQFLELGTSKMPARPWLRPAFESSQDAMLQMIGDEMRKRVEKIAKRRAAK
jgi:HK97 gp10 family phage protein